jgi:hypothetical protein
LNQCAFFGEIIDVQITNDRVKRAEIKLRVVVKKKSRQGNSINEQNILTFEAWDSAADVIENTPNGCYLLVSRSTARNSNDGGVIFRIDSFSTVGSSYE